MPLHHPICWKVTTWMNSFMYKKVLTVKCFCHDCLKLCFKMHTMHTFRFYDLISSDAGLKFIGRGEA